MEITVDIPLKPLVEEFDELTFGTLALVFQELGYGQTMFDEYVQAVNEWMVQQHCGEKYARGNRAGG